MIKDEIKEFYNDLAEEMAKEWFENDLLMDTWREIMAMLKKNPEILDIGCGTGHECKRIIELGGSVTGIDYSENNIKIAKERCPNGKFILEDLRNININMGKYDGIIACASIIHLKADELEILLKKLALMLENNGILSLIFISGEGIDSDKSKITKNGKTYQRLFYLHSTEKINEALNVANLKYVKKGYLPLEIEKYGWENHIYTKLAME